MGELAQARLQIAALEKSVSEQDRRLLDLQRSESIYRTVADNTFDWEFWLSPGGADFLYCSPSALRITGYLPDKFLADPGLFFRIIHRDDLCRVAENLNRKRIEKGFCEIEFRIITSGGEERWIALAFLGIYDENGNYRGIRGSGREITASKAIGKQIPEKKSAER